MPNRLTYSLTWVLNKPSRLRQTRELHPQARPFTHSIAHAIRTILSRRRTHALPPTVLTIHLQQCFRVCLTSRRRNPVLRHRLCQLYGILSRGQILHHRHGLHWYQYRPRSLICHHQSGTPHRQYRTTFQASPHCRRQQSLQSLPSAPHQTIISKRAGGKSVSTSAQSAWAG